jgi:hypothetical protein
MAKEKSIPVASIKSMADETPTFTLPLKIKRLNGTETQVEVTALAMRKSEWAALRDANMGVEKVDQPAGDAPRFSFVKAVGDDMRKGAELIVKCGVSWDLADPFTADSLMELEDKFGGTLARFLGDYDAAIFHGRVGN